MGAKNTKARSYKLGYSYGPEALRLIWGGNERQRQEEIKKEAEAFTDWLYRKGKSCFEFNDKGQIINTDFNLLDKLHEEYELEKSTTGGTPVTPDRPVEEPANPQKKTDGKARKPSGASSNRVARQTKPSPDIFRRDLESVGKLISGIEDIVRRLSAAQEEPRTDSKRIDQAVAEFEFNGNKNYEKSL